jgi:UPF0176 protein
MLRYIVQNVIPITGNGKRLLQPSICNYFTRRFLFTTQKFKPIAFYSIVALTEARVATLRNVLEKELSAFGVVGRIYIAPEQGIGGINCQMAVPIDKLDAVKSYFDDFKNEFGQIEYSEGIQDTSSPNFTKLRVLVKNSVSQV